MFLLLLRSCIILSRFPEDWMISGEKAERYNKESAALQDEVEGGSCKGRSVL